jgi:acetylglutamate kinase
VREKIFVIKIGGAIVENTGHRRSFLQKIASCKTPRVLVHGGWLMTTHMCRKMGIPVQMVDGKRITDEDALEVTTMVYGGFISKTLVAELQALGCPAIGLTGADANIIEAHKRPVDKVDYGFVGDIDRVCSGPLEMFFQAGILPILSPLTHDKNSSHGSLLTTNADMVACKTAIALSEKFDVELIFCFDQNGILADVSENDSVITQLTENYHQLLSSQGQIHSDMKLILQNAFQSLKNGVAQVRVCHVNDIHRALNGQSVGTLCTLE